MTAILWSKNRLYADSLHVKGSEKFHSLTKIHALPAPLPLRHPKESVDDMILGWVCTGADLCGAGFIQAVEQFAEMGTEKDFATVIAIYEAFERFNMANYENLFEVIMIGGKANYSFIFNPLSGRQKVRFEVYPHTKRWGIGSGGGDASEAVADGAQPIRGMYHAFYRDEHSGGMVDVWELTPGDNPTFKRVGVYNEVPKPQLPAQLLDMKAAKEFDLVPQPTLAQMLDTLRATQSLPTTRKKATPKKAPTRSITKRKKA